MTTSDRIEKFISLASLALRIRNSDVSWKLKYELIFSKEISNQMRDLNLVPCYRSPVDATNYEGCVVAFVDAVEERRIELLKIQPIVGKDNLSLDSKGN